MLPDLDTAPPPGVLCVCVCRCMYGWVGVGVWVRVARVGRCTCGGVGV